MIPVWIFLTITLFNFSCSNKKIELDIKMISDDKSMSADIAASNQQTVLSKDIFEWEEFFKGNPTRSERAHILKNLEKWPNSSNEDQLLEKARKQIAIGQTSLATLTLKECLRVHPSSLEAYLQLATLKVQLHKPEHSISILASLKEVLDNQEAIEANILFRYKYILAATYTLQRKYQKSRKILRELIKINPDFIPAYSAIAISYITNDKLKLAEFVCKRGLNKSQDSAPLNNLMGVINEKHSKEQEAERWYDEALRINPFYTSALINKSQILLKRNEISEAAEYALKALQTDSNNSDALILMAHFKSLNGKNTDAQHLLLKALDLNPMNAFARYNLAVLTINKLENPNESIRLFHESALSANHDLKLQKQALSNEKDLKESKKFYTKVSD